MYEPVKLGERYRDELTGFVGIATARTEYLYGCARVGLQAPLSENGSLPGIVYIDELQLKGIASDPAKGGPRPDPPAR